MNLIMNSLAAKNKNKLRFIKIKISILIMIYKKEKRDVLIKRKINL